MAPVRKIKKPTKKTKKKPSIVRRKKHVKKRATVKRKTKARKTSPRMEYMGLNLQQAPLQRHQVTDDMHEIELLEKIGFHSKMLPPHVRAESLRRLGEFENRAYKSIYENIFVMLSASNALRSKQEKIINIMHLPFFEDVELFHEDLLLLRLARLSDVLEPAKRLEISDLVKSLIDGTSNILSEISDKFPKKSLENNIFTELNNMFASTPLPKFIEFCRQVSSDIDKIEEHAKTMDLHDAYVKRFSDYRI